MPKRFDPPALEMLIVEFVGAAGSGKSTIADLTATMLIERGLKCARRPALVEGLRSKAWHTISIRLHRRRRIILQDQARQFSLSLRPTQLSRAHAADYLIFLHYYLTQIACRNYDVVIMDESFVHCIWSMMVGATRVDLSAMDHLISALYCDMKGTMLFGMVEVDAQTASERARARNLGLSRFDFLPGAIAEDLIRSNENRLQRAVKSACRAADAPLQMLDGLQPADCNAASLANLIEMQVRGAEASGGQKRLVQNIDLGPTCR
jgi:thymidylate kinase